MGRWRSLLQLRADFAASGIQLPPPRSPAARTVHSCGRKIRYGSEADAIAHASELWLDVHEHRRRRQRLNVYACRWCGGFHVGHLRPPRP